MDLFTTEFTTVEGIFIVAPNSQLGVGAPTNFSRTSTPHDQMVLEIGYGGSIDPVIETGKRSSINNR
ncbi:MAG: hypothetical protein EVA87_14400 [Rhodospirillaceae bacterium]|nr:MAG: hypothetical protein EVA87_14400 [Rhodospirillaceae bacterium]